MPAAAAPAPLRRPRPCSPAASPPPTAPGARSAPGIWVLAPTFGRDSAGAPINSARSAPCPPIARCPSNATTSGPRRRCGGRRRGCLEPPACPVIARVRGTPTHRGQPEAGPKERGPPPVPRAPRTEARRTAQTCVRGLLCSTMGPTPHLDSGNGWQGSRRCPTGGGAGTRRTTPDTAGRST
eukprot:scaffold9107_cov112-Isochrysis_galbana.AAC.7